MRAAAREQVTLQASRNSQGPKNLNSIWRYMYNVALVADKQALEIKHLANLATILPYHPISAPVQDSSDVLCRTNKRGERLIPRRRRTG